jgi:hypothetical protein
MFVVYGGKCLSRKTVHNWVVNLADDEEAETEVQKWLRPVKRLVSMQRVSAHW